MQKILIVYFEERNLTVQNNLNIALYIARRYLFSGKSKNAVNLITAISLLGVAIGTLALVVVLSVFNGFESLIKSMYQEVNSDFVISSTQSKSFNVKDINLEGLKAIAPWSSIQEVYEEKVLLRNDDKEHIAKLKGVSIWPSTDSLIIEKHIFKGNSFRNYSSDNWAIVGQSLAYTLSLSVQQTNPLKVFVPNPEAKTSSLKDGVFLQKKLFISGVFSVQSDYDASYLITALSGVQEYLNKEDFLTSIDLELSSEESLDGIQNDIESLLGDEFTVENRFQQQEFLYKVLQTEKWAIFFILAFILLIATFNIVASVIMIVLEKRKDISSLWAMGTPVKTIQKIFFYEGFLITFFGGGLGVLVGVVLCFAQQKYGFIKLGEQGSFIVNTYPVEVQWADVGLIMLTVMSIGILVTSIPVSFIKRKFIQSS
jgi:lipoprotein-releasing system permease protein